VEVSSFVAATPNLVRVPNPLSARRKAGPIIPPLYCGRVLSRDFFSTLLVFLNSRPLFLDRGLGGRSSFWPSHRSLHKTGNGREGGYAVTPPPPPGGGRPRILRFHEIPRDGGGRCRESGAGQVKCIRIRGPPICKRDPTRMRTKTWAPLTAAAGRLDFDTPQKKVRHSSSKHRQTTNALD